MDIRHASTCWAIFEILKTTSTTLTELRDAFYARNLSEPNGMNLLTEHGIISDHVVTMAEIARADLPRAVAFIKNFTS